MKGVIVNCMAELVHKKFGEEKWQDALERVGLSRDACFFSNQDVEDQAILNMLEALGDILHLSPSQLADAFGEYWITVFAPRIYGVYYRNVNSARDFLLQLDKVHKASTKYIPGSRPPMFDYHWKNDNTLVMQYKSERNLIDLMIGLVKGVGKYYNQELKITKLSADKLEIVFL